MRAFMGVIGKDIRLIKVSSNSGKVFLDVIFEEGASEESVEAAKVAGSEIIADFPELKIEERFLFTNQKIPNEDIVAAGWIYRRKDSDEREP